MKYCYLLFFIAALLAGTGASAQRNASAPQQAPPSAADDTLGVVVHADPRLALLTYSKGEHKPVAINGHKAGSIYSTRGFRVQIYSGNDRNVATQRKVDFIRRFPGVRSYMTYVSPTFRVKVGDFKDRRSAQAMYQQLSKLYTPCMIVNDIIEVNTFRND